VPKSIPTVRELRRRGRRLDRHNIRIERVLAELRRGETLQLCYSPRPLWRLSSGAFIPHDIARVVVGLPCVAGCGDTLLAGEPSQTFHYVDGREEIAP
jgi:hypothetical protein